VIYLCFGMVKSGSTLAYELTRALLATLSHPQDRLHCPFLEDHNINFLSGTAMREFNRESLRMIEQEAPSPKIVSFKTHTSPTTIFRELAQEGLLIGQANFRDPRDTILSLLDAGERSNQRGEGAFSKITSW